MSNSSQVVHNGPVDFSGGVVVLVSGGEQSQILILIHRLKFDKSVPCNQRISLRVGEFFFHFAIFCQSLIFLSFLQGIFSLIRILFRSYTFSSNYSFIAKTIPVEINKRKNHISLRVGKFPWFENFFFPTRREIPYASVQTDCYKHPQGREGVQN